jgi:spoIIIJ-associated protein
MNAQPKIILETLLKHLDFPATVEQAEEDGLTLLDVKTEEPGRLIGRQGQTLADIQYLVNRILFTQDREAPKVLVDVGGYRRQAREALAQRAREAAERVRRWGEPVELEPMNPSDRRCIHQAIKDDPDIESVSVEVEGTDRKAIILRPKSSTARS